MYTKPSTSEIILIYGALRDKIDQVDHVMSIELKNEVPNEDTLAQLESFRNKLITLCNKYIFMLPKNPTEPTKPKVIKPIKKPKPNHLKLV